jgi:putative oxidoreductase
MIWTGLTRYRDEGLLILRIGLGIAFIFHGLPKLMGGPDAWAGLGGAMGLPAPAAFGFIAAIIEFGGGILLAVGWLFRPANILLALQMLAAMIFHFQQGDEYSQWSHPLKMLIVFVALILIGPGRYSLDKNGVEPAGRGFEPVAPRTTTTPPPAAPPPSGPAA